MYCGLVFLQALYICVCVFYEILNFFVNVGFYFYFYFFSGGINTEAPGASSSGSAYVRPHGNSRNAILVSHRQVSVCACA